MADENNKKITESVPNKYKRLYDKSFGNRKEMQAAKQGACFHCLRVFNSQLIRAWEDGEQTAVCPYCLIDSVIPVDSKINLEVLKKLQEYYFNKEINTKEKKNTEEPGWAEKTIKKQL